jgi:transaldolase
MKFFIDSAEIAELRAWHERGLLDGVTTNPSLIAKSGRKVFEVLEEICAIAPVPVSAEVVATDTATMLQEAAKLRAIAPNIVIKAPLTWDGLKATRALADQGVPVNVTLCFSAAQALLAAKAGAAYISPFVGRLDDVGEDGMQLIRDIRKIYDNYPWLTTEILAASIRSADHVKEAALAGADVATIPSKVAEELASHKLTDKGLDAFLKDWAATGQSLI